MAKGLNRVQLLGNLGKAPEVAATRGGTVVATFSLATPERIKQGDEWKDATEWHSCVAFGRLAEILQQYTGKGSKLLVEGRLQTRSWDDKQSGQKRYRTEIIVSDVTLLDGAKQKAQTAERPTDPVEQYRSDYGGQGITDDDIPF